MPDLCIGQVYPVAIGNIKSVLHNFVTDGNTVIFSVPNMDEVEKQAMVHGDIEVGLIVKENAIRLLWRCMSGKKTVLVFDELFNARQTQGLLLNDIETDKERLQVILHIVDGATNILEGARALTMPPAITINFLSAVQDQLAIEETAQEKSIQAKWHQQSSFDLIKSTNMYRMGNARNKLRPQLSPQIRASIKRKFDSQL